MKTRQIRSFFRNYPEENKNKFIEEINNENFYRGKAFSLALVLLGISMYIANVDKTIEIFIVYMSLIVGSAVLSVFFFRIPKNLTGKNLYNYKYILYMLLEIFVLYWANIRFSAFPEHFAVTLTFTLIMMIIPVVYYLKWQTFIWLYSINIFLSTLLLNIINEHTSSTSLYTIVFINFTIAAFIISRIFYLSKLRNFITENELNKHREYLEELVRKRTEKIEEANKEIRESFDTLIYTLSKVVRMKDAFTSAHQERVSELVVAIAKEMNLKDEKIEALRISALVHDIGKLNLPSGILNKPGKLTEIEKSMIRTHVQHSYDLLKEIRFQFPIHEYVLQHHERLDGSGYPNELKGEEISLEGRILAVVDVVEAMVSHRPYRAAYNLENALDEISNNCGTLYDEKVVKACQRVFSNGFEFEIKDYN